mgnify:CR=1 FL=1
MLQRLNGVQDSGFAFCNCLIGILYRRPKILQFNGSVSLDIRIIPTSDSYYLYIS